MLTLGEAATRLGVHPATLRRWADKGDIEVVVTPGGHRRFPQDEVERLATRGDSRNPGTLTKRWASEAISSTRAELVHHRDERWLAESDEAERAQKRELGQRLMGLMMQYIAMEGDAGADLLEEARQIGLQYGQGSRQGGLGLADALQATMFFRDNIVESAVILPEAARLRPEANKRLLRRINAFLNTIQLAITEAYG